MGCEYGYMDCEDGTWTARMGAWTARMGTWAVRMGIWTARMGTWTARMGTWAVRMGTWTARTVWRAQGRKSNGQVRSYLANTCLCAAVLAALLVIGGVEQNPGPGVEDESFM